MVMETLICQDHVAKEKALQTMSSMSSAQIVSATTAMHSKSAGLNLGLTHNPVSYPGAVSCPLPSLVPLFCSLPPPVCPYSLVPRNVQEVLKIKNYGCISKNCLNIITHSDGAKMVLNVRVVL